MRDYLYIMIIAAAVTYLLTPLVRRFALLIKAQREPRARDVHKEPTPLIGGVAMYAGMATALLVAERLSYLKLAFPSSRTVNGLLAAGLLLVVIGIIDDRFEIGAMSKLAGQIAAGGILAYSGAYLYWLPLPGGSTFSLEPDLSVTLTVLLIVVTINAVNFIDGLDGLAAGVVGIAGLAFFIYSYTLTNSIDLQSQSVPAVASAVLVGMCAGFLPHNFNPARIFMGDTGSMLIGMLLAYGPIASNSSLDSGVLVNYSHLHPLNRFPTILPILLPVAILIIPYADFFLAVIRRTARGHSPFAPDRKHLHHRLQSMGHSHRQSVLLMYLWAAVFSGIVVGLSVIRTELVWPGVVTVAAMIALLFATIPQWRPWRKRGARHLPKTSAPAAQQPAASPPLFPNAPATPPYPASSAGPASAPGKNGYRVAADGAPQSFTGSFAADDAVRDGRPSEDPTVNGHAPGWLPDGQAANGHAPGRLPDGRTANGYPPNGTHQADETADGWPWRDSPAPPKYWPR
jgi:UDP-GlcNAc:undecaprenyl-phosphate GlcNAc-1-phosphate transferase